MKLLSKSKTLLAVLGLLCLAYFAYSHFGQKSDSSNIGTVTRADLVQRVTIAGTVNPNHKSIISAPYNGYVKKIYVQIGDQVKTGDPIVSVTQSLRGNEEVYPMRAPFPGTVVQILRSEGEYVSTTDATTSSLVRIDDLTKLYVEANAPEIEVAKLRLGQDAIIKASAILDRSYHGKIEHISLAAKEQKDWDKSRVEFPVLIGITDKDAAIEPGMSVVVDIITSKLSKVLTLRHEFIQKVGDQYYVVTEKGEKKPIDVGLQNEESFEIKKGVAEGDRIRQTDFLSLLKEQ
jgi:multidrug efflux pump subunit AcrA (membrane-fusion protein)